MFYISKMTNSYYWVTDSEDGVTERLSSSELSDYLIAGIDIKGCDCEFKYFKNGSRAIQRWNVNVYNINPSAGDAKRELLQGIKTVIKDGVLISLEVSKTTTEPIRLSDFCTYLDSYCFDRSWGFSTIPTIILDSKIEYLDSKAFNMSHGYKVIIEQGTRQEVIDSLYKQYVPKVTELSNFILDYNKDRLNMYLIFSLIEQGSTHKISQFFHTHDISREDTQRYCDMWYKKNGKKLQTFLKADVKLVDFDGWHRKLSWDASSYESVTRVGRNVDQCLASENRVELLYRYLRQIELSRKLGTFISYTNANKKAYVKALILLYFSYNNELLNSVVSFIGKIVSECRVNS